jgi:hypothetical protein
VVFLVLGVAALRDARDEFRSEKAARDRREILAGRGILVKWARVGRTTLKANPFSSCNLIKKLGAGQACSRGYQRHMSIIVRRSSNTAL